MSPVHVTTMKIVYEQKQLNTVVAPFLCVFTWHTENLWQVIIIPPEKALLGNDQQYLLSSHLTITFLSWSIGSFFDEI